jgi:hypothetical protein
MNVKQARYVLSEVGVGGEILEFMNNSMDDKGRLFRTTFDSPIMVTEDDVLESRWTKDGQIFTLNGVDIPSTTEVISSEHETG